MKKEPKQKKKKKKRERKKMVDMLELTPPESEPAQLNKIIFMKC